MCKTTQRKISEACVHGSIFTITKRQMQPKCPLTCKRINKILHTHTHTHTHTMGYYAALKRKEILTYATT